MANDDEIYFRADQQRSVYLLAAIQCFSNTKDFFFSVATSFLIAHDEEDKHCSLTKTAKHVFPEKKKVSIVPSGGNN